MSDLRDLTFPPLMWGEDAGSDAMGHAVRRATLGCDAGLISYVLGAAKLEAAMVFAPELPLSRALAMLPLCGVGFQNALGALAPPEVAVHLEWGGGLRINGASCGRFKVDAASHAPEREPDWLVVGLTLPLLPESDDPGVTPDRTALFAEGCSDVDPAMLIEAWARHTLNWITRWESEGTRPLHAEWRGLVHALGETTCHDGITGTFLGVDEDFGMLLREGETTHLIPLTRLLSPEAL